MATDRVNQARSIERVIASLRAARAVGRSMLVAQRLAWIVAAVIGATLVAGGLDYLLHLPWWLRSALLIAGAGVIGESIWKFVRPAVGFAPSLTEVALRLEATEAGGKAGLRGVLASGVDLAQERSTGNVALAGPVIEEAANRFGGLSAASVLSGGRTGRAALWLLTALIAAAGVSVSAPEHTRIGVARVLMPWTNTQWPKRTAVADATDVTVHPLGSALPLRAVLLRSVGDPESARVVGKYRLLIDDVAGPTRKVLLTSQGRHVVVDKEDGEEGSGGRGRTVDTGTLFERLIEPSATTAEGTPGDGNVEKSEIEYWFETDDDWTEHRRVLLVEPPRVLAATLDVSEPEYVGRTSVPAAEGGTGDSAIDLGAGTDDRAAPRPMLQGSRLSLVLNLNKPLPAPAGAAPAAFIEGALGPEFGALVAPGGAGEDGGLVAELDGSTWRLTWTLRESVRAVVRLTDEHGIRSVDECVFRFESREDKPPTVTVTEPTQDEAVLATARVDLRAEARDDVGLEGLSIQRRIARAPSDSEGAPAEPIEDYTDVVTSEGGRSTDVRLLTTTTILQLATLPVKPGDEVWVSALASDAYELYGARHEPVRSGVRKLRIIAADKLVAQLWTELGAVRESAIRMDQEQGELAQASGRAGNAEKSQRQQAQLTERIAREAKQVQTLRERTERNGLTDAELSDVLDQAESSLERAGEQSVGAGTSLEEMARAEREGREAPSPARESAGKEQGEVRDALSDLISLLDQGRDTYAMKRQIERLLEEQRSLQDRTKSAGAKTTGRAPEDLSKAEKEALDQIAADQRTNAQRAADAIEQMLSREPQVAETDRAAAQAMGDAARSGERSRVADRMRDAAQQVQQNQTNSAQGSQGQAIESLEEMLEQIKNAGRNRDEVLRRQLASIIESLKSLIQRQEAALEQLAEARAADASTQPFANLDEPMILLHQNTLGVLGEAQGNRDLAPVAALIDRAAVAQADAVGELRKSPVDAGAVGGKETASLDALKEAKEKAEELDRQAQDRETARQRSELKKAYAEALREQKALQEETSLLVGQEATRRMKAAARTLGDRQSALRNTLAELREKTTDLNDAIVFDFAHTRLDDLMGQASLALGRGEAESATTRRQAAAARLLASLVDALASPNDEDDDFREQQANSGGSGGGQGGKQPLVPPLAELRLLRAMQQEAADRTRDAGDAVAEGHAMDEAEMAEIAKLQTDLASHGEELVRKLMQNGGNEGGDGPQNPSRPDRPTGPQ